jgi:hypothetical protein
MRKATLEGTKSKEINETAIVLFKLMEENGCYSIGDIGAVANIQLKSVGHEPRKEW